MQPDGITKNRRETQKNRYAALRQLIAMANLFNPRLEWPSLSSLDEQIDKWMNAFQKAETNEQRKEAFRRHDEAMKLKACTVDLAFMQAVEMFPAEAAGYESSKAKLLAAIRVGDRHYVFRNADEFYEGALAVRDALRMLVKKKAKRLPIELPVPNIPTRVQIMPDGTAWLAPNLVRDFLAPALHRIDLEVLQFCPNCDRLVLAVRKRTYQTCSPECANVERARAHRAKNPDYYTADERNKRKKISDRKRKAAAKRKAQ